jgi:hypothetical protein
VRVLFLLLILANLAFFAWANYLSPHDAASDPRPLAQQYQPEKLKILAPEDAGAVSKPWPAAVPAACLEWGSFTLADAPRAEQALEPLALGPRLAQRRAEETASWWVYLPPQGSRQNALKKAGELKALKVEEFFVMQEEGPLRWAVSLGVFKTEEAAKGRLEALRAQGVRTAQIGERETQVPKVWLQVSNPDAPLQARLKEIAAGFPGSELKSCPAS